MDHYDSLKEHLAEIEKSLEADMAPFALQVEQLSSIYGISTTLPAQSLLKSALI